MDFLTIKGLLQTSRKDENGQTIYSGIASTEHRDRHREIIRQDGWDLEEFKANPVILAQHDSWKFPIGKAIKIYVEDKQLKFDFILTEASEAAREAAALIKEGILKTFSVGFRADERDENDRSIITAATLFEISLVTIPANPHAVIVAKSMSGNSFASLLSKEWDKDSQLKDVLTDEEISQLEMYKEGKLHALDIANMFSAKSKATMSREEKHKVDVNELDIQLLQKTVGGLQEVLAKAKTRKVGEK